MVEAHNADCGCSLCSDPNTGCYWIRVETTFFEGRKFRIPRIPNDLSPPNDIGVPDHGALLHCELLYTEPDGTLVYG